MWYQVIVVEFMDKVLQMVDVDLQAALLAELAANKVQREIRPNISHKMSVQVELLLKTGIKRVYKGEGGTSTNEWEKSDIPEVQLTNTP